MERLWPIVGIAWLVHVNALSSGGVELLWSREICLSFRWYRAGHNYFFGLCCFLWLRWCILYCWLLSTHCRKALCRYRSRRGSCANPMTLSYEVWDSHCIIEPMSKKVKVTFTSDINCPRRAKGLILCNDTRSICVKPTNVDEAGFFSRLGSTVTPYLGLTFFFFFFLVTNLHNLNSQPWTLGKAHSPRIN